MTGAARRGAIGTTRVPVLACLTLAVILGTVTALPTMAQGGVSPASDRTIDVTAYGWLAGTTGTVGVSGQRAKVDDSLGDTLRQTDSLIGLMGRGELRQGRLGLFLDAQHISLDHADARVGRVTLDARSRLTIVESGAAWQVAGSQPGGWELDVLGGGRWTHLRNELRIVGAGTLADTADWVDPFVGLRLRGRLSERWEYSLRGDIGGFGVGTRFAWQAAATLGYRLELFGRPATALVGYRALHQDYSSRELTYDVTMHGPVIGLNIRF
jgi:hypothetical protein